MKRMGQYAARWIRLVGVMGLSFASGCASSSNQLVDNEPAAMQVAADRAKFELACATPVLTLKSSEMTAPKKGRSQQAKYAIQAEGCGKSKIIDIYCQEGDAGCAMLDNY